MTTARKKPINFRGLLSTQNDVLRQRYLTVEGNSSGTFWNKYSDRSIEDLYCKIYGLSLSEFQRNIIDQLFSDLRRISEIIEPEKLIFEVSNTEEGEIVMHRKSINGVTDLVVNYEEGLAVSYVGFDGENTLDFFDTNVADFDCENLAYTFLGK